MIPESDADSICNSWDWDPAFRSELCFYDSRIGFAPADRIKIITVNIVLYAWFRFENDIFKEKFCPNRVYF